MSPMRRVLPFIAWLCAARVSMAMTVPSQIDLANAPGSVGADYTCSATQLCASGCCRLDPSDPQHRGYCGLGPTFCGAGNCTSTCTEKSQCDPGWGPQWSLAEGCPLNVCCSSFGFCGTTEAFCGSNQPARPSCSTKTTAKRTVGYYEGWSTERSCQQVDPSNITLGAYTHLNIAFAYIDPVSFVMAPMDPIVAGQYNAITSLKGKQAGLETWLSIGGWTFNDPGPTGSTFSQLAASTSAQQNFFGSLLTLIDHYDFDGCDIDWEYPGALDRNGSPADYANYVSFLKNLRSFFDNSGRSKRLGISITIASSPFHILNDIANQSKPSSYYYLQNFDIKGIDPVVDWFNLMTYDLHGTWDSPQDQIGSIALAHTNLTEIKSSLDLLWRNNIDPSKVNLGLGFYGRSFTLTDPSCKAAGCPFSTGGIAGPCTNTSGILSYTEIENVIRAGATVVFDPVASVEIATWDNNQWVSYDDEKSFKGKIDYANSVCLGGTLIWAVDLDVDGSAINALTGAGDIPLHNVANGTVVPDHPDFTLPTVLPTVFLPSTTSVSSS